MRGAGVTVLAQGLVFSVQLISTVVLARLPMPSDFGLVAMVTTFSLLLVSFGQNGYAEAVMQREAMDRYLASNLFWITTGAGLLLGIVFAAAGPLLARFYGEPRVVQVAAVLSVTIVLNSLPVVHVALLKRALRFSVTSAIDILATVIAVVSYPPGLGRMGLLGAGGGAYYPSGGSVSRCLESMRGFRACRAVWPVRPLWCASRSMSTAASASTIRHETRTTFLSDGASAPLHLGFYKKAYDMFLLPVNQLLMPVSDVVLSTLSRLERGSAEFRRYFLNGLSILAFVGLGAGALLTLEGRI